MIRLNVSAVHLELDDKIEDYVNQKIGALDRFVPASLRGPVHGHVILTENDGAAKERYTCEVTLNLPYGQVVAKEATPNSIFAAVDLAEKKAKAQLLKYKSKRTDSRGRVRRLMRRLRTSWPTGRA